MATNWTAVEDTGGEPYTDIRYEKSAAPEEGIAKITIARPEVRNAFRPQTIIEISRALEDAREDPSIGVIVLTGEGEQRRSARAATSACAATPATSTRRGRAASGVGRFHVTDLHIQIRRLPKPVVAMVAGYAIGGGHVLHLVCDLTIAAENARFGQVGPQGRLLRRRLRRGPARRTWSGRRRRRRSGSCAASTPPQEALEMGLVNTVVPLERLEQETVAWCGRCSRCRPSRCAC